MLGVRLPTSIHRTLGLSGTHPPVVTFMSLHPGFAAAADLFAKLEREYASLLKLVTPDGMMNFAITAWSLCEWTAKDPKLNSRARAGTASIRSNKSVQICRDLANGSKHFEVTSYTPTVSDATAASGFGQGRYGVGAYRVGESSIRIETPAGRVDGLDVAAQVMELWRKFFNEHASSSP